MSNKDNIVITFVVLQYGAYFATKNCIESIYSNVRENFCIIVVDNCSPDNSLELLKGEYGKHKKIIILESESNLGFSKGNNIGFQYAKLHLSPQYIVLMNNDTELLDNKFIDKIHTEYSLSHFAVMGPMILTGDGEYTSNPSHVRVSTKEEIKKCIKFEKIFLKFEQLNLGFIYNIYIKRKKKRKKGSISKAYSHTLRQENVQLHGSFMIFSRNYIDLFDGLNPQTFMYAEEPILYLRLKKHKLKSVYNPKIQIYHAEDASTNWIYKKSKKKRIFYFENHIHSCKILLDFMKETTC